MRIGPRRIAAGLLIATGAICLAYAGVVTARAWVWQERRADLFRDATRTVVNPARAEPAPQVDPPSPARGEALARLRVPRLGIDVVVAEGTDPRTLSLGPGHLEGSALPGERDNCIIAGHRDGPFGRLRGARPGDRVEISDRLGLRSYRVDSIDVVDKHDTRALAPSDTPLLTLVTCYPFHYVGHAPQRFIVRASLMDDRS